jgi:hypothetical protein
MAISIPGGGAKLFRKMHWKILKRLLQYERRDLANPKYLDRWLHFFAAILA